MIGQKHQGSSFLVAIANAPQPFGISLQGIKDDQMYFLIANQARAAIDRPRVDSFAFEVGFGAGNEEALALVEAIEPLEIQVSAVHDVEGARLGNQHIEDVDVVQFAVGNVNKTGNCPAQVEQCVQFDRGFRAAELGPRKHRETKVDGGGIQGI